MDPFNQSLFSNVPPPEKRQQLNLDTGIYATGFAAAVALFVANKELALKLSYGIMSVGRGPSGKLGVSPLAAYYVIFPPPFGFANPSKFGLETNYFRTFLQRLGVEESSIPESELFSTQPDNPAIIAERQRIAAHVQRNNYARLSSGFTTEQLLSDYALFRGKQLGLIRGPAIDLPLGALADAAAEELVRRGIDQDELNDALAVTFDNFTNSQKFTRRHQVKGQQTKGVQTVGGIFGFVDSLFSQNPPDPR